MSTRGAKRTSKPPITTETTIDAVDEEVTALSTLPPKINRFIQLWMTGQYSQAKVAQLLDIPINTVKTWMKRDDVKQAIVEFQEMSNKMAAARLGSLQVGAVEAMATLLSSPIDGVKYQAARDILDRTGHKAKQEIKVDKTVTTVEQKFKELVESTIIDAEFEEVLDS